MKAAYIHIPFCEHICYYCDFNKVFLKGQPVDEYIEALLKEMRLQLERTPVNQLETIFVGGGTPTVLNETQLDRLCNGIRSILPFQNGEFTFEANPGDLSEEKLRILHEYGVNRLSFGVQSFNNELLKKIGRTHTSDDVFETLTKAEKAGFENISIDLMYALPGQTEDDFRNSLRTALELNLPHYSSYSLIVEPKTVFYNLMRKGKLHLPSEDAEAKMYDILITEMERHGLHQYEISNFAKPGFESKHNLVYWDNEEYFGFGAGAHSYVERVRRSNCGPVKKYLSRLENDELPIFDQHKLTKQEMMEEEMFLGLRKNEGVSLVHFKEKYNENVLDVFGNAISEMVERKLLEVTDNRIKLTKEGRFIGNEVFQAFLM